MPGFGVYIHVPWCRSRCPYCDFAIAIGDVPHRPYLDAVQAELAVRAPEFAGRELSSIYLGGGTPSLWDPACIAELIASVSATWNAATARLEITLEANPADCTSERLAAWQRAGVNRLSIGVQATRARDLAVLGRDHAMGDGLRALRAVRAAGYRAFSADIILGTPGSREPLAAVDDILSLQPPHLSVYELTVEERTPFGRAVARGEIVPCDDDRLAALYEETDRRLTAAGYEHYEVSSYARPGARALHNSLYWTGGEYLGLGNGAASFWRGEGCGRRWSNLRSVGAYLTAAPDQRIAELEELGPRELADDAVWLGLRTADGVPEAALEGRPQVLEALLRDALVERRDAYIRPTLRGFLYANQVAGRVVGS